VAAAAAVAVVVSVFRNKVKTPHLLLLVAVAAVVDLLIQIALVGV
jgi:hypothetical protein